jgi:glycerophosphoryl diester phosphodiesterase
MAGAHQGGLFHLNFNTLQRFESARLAGVNLIETDLRLTKDGVPVVFHDAKLDVLTRCKGLVSSKTLAEIKKCRLRFSNNFIPTFEELLIWADGRLVINVEFKERQVIIPALNLLAKYKATEWVYFQCKADPESYSIARAYDREAHLLFAPNGPSDLAWALELEDPKLTVIEIHANLRTPEFINLIRASGKLVSENSWHFSKTKELFGAKCETAYNLGIDIAISNSPKTCVAGRIRYLKRKKDRG